MFGQFFLYDILRNVNVRFICRLVLFSKVNLNDSNQLYMSNLMKNLLNLN